MAMFCVWARKLENLRFVEFNQLARFKNFRRNSYRIGFPTTILILKHDFHTTKAHMAANSNGTIDYYQILNIPVTANSKQIKAAYYQMSKIYHPDLHQRQGEEKISENHASSLTPQEAAAKFRQITEAYEILGNEMKRKRYDYYLHRKKYAVVVPEPGTSAWQPNGTATDGDLDKQNLDDIDDEILRQLLKYERLRKFRREQYRKWSRKPFVHVDVNLEESKAQNGRQQEDNELHRKQEEVRRRHEEELKNDRTRDRWTSSASDKQNKPEEPLSYKNIEEPTAEKKRSIFFYVFDFFRRWKQKAKSAMADRDIFHEKMMFYFIGITTILGATGFFNSIL